MTKLARPLCPLNYWSNNASSRIRSSINSRLGKRCLGVMPISWIYCREQRDLAGTETLPGQPLKKRTRVRSTSWEAGCGRRRETSYKAADRLIPMLHWFFGESYLTRSLAGSLHNFEDQLKRLVGSKHSQANRSNSALLFSRCWFAWLPETQIKRTGTIKCQMPKLAPKTEFEWLANLHSISGSSRTATLCPDLVTMTIVQLAGSQAVTVDWFTLQTEPLL